ncbi:hypothetical protein B0H14DRAFT_2577198 [Mycena olivaceomarginata]|nr:hypothetical protein B0H14DRAFT_2577198 [Mycena olivaceomarginata]
MQVLARDNPLSPSPTSTQTLWTIPPSTVVKSKPESLAAKDTHSDMVNELKTTSRSSLQNRCRWPPGNPTMSLCRDEAKENVSTTCANRSLIGPNCCGPACWYYCIIEFIRSSNHLACETPTSKDTASRAVHNPEVTSGSKHKVPPGDTEESLKSTKKSEMSL